MRRWLVIAALALGAAVAEDATAAPSATEVRERNEADAAGEEPYDSRTDEEKQEQAEDKELWGEDAQTEEEIKKAKQEAAYKMFMKLAERYQEKQEKKYEERETELYHQPKELVRRSKRAMSWGDVNASTSMYIRAVQLASKDNTTDAFALRRQIATEMGVSMYLDGFTSHAASLLKSLVSDMNFENTTSVQEEAERVIWLGAAHMREHHGSLEGEESFETLKKLSNIHLELFPDWEDMCLRAAFRLFMTNNEKALADLNACMEADSKVDRFRANYFLAIYADARYKESLARKYGRAAFRLLPSGECDVDDFSPAAFQVCSMMAFAKIRQVNVKKTCPCFDDHFYTDAHGNKCKDHAGWDCTAYSKWPNEDAERWTKADENELIDKCPRSCDLCHTEQPCEFLEGRKREKDGEGDVPQDPYNEKKAKKKKDKKNKKKKKKEL